MKYACNKGRKGFVFTIEAFLSLLVVISLLSAISLLQARESTHPKFVILADTWEVLEKGYHDDLAVWIDADVCDAGCAKAVQKISLFLGKIEQKTQQKISLKYGTNRIPEGECDEDITIARLTVSARARQEDGGSWHRVWISLCK